MGLHPNFSVSPYAPLIPEQRWFPADETDAGSMDIFEIGGETFHKEPNLLEQIAYRDTWGRGADSFIAMIYERLILMRDLMHEEASIYVHCDYRVNSFMRSILEEVFGSANFRDEIIWKEHKI